MWYRILRTAHFDRQMRKLERSVRIRVSRYVVDILATLDDPKKLGKMFVGDMGGLYRYRIGFYRLICRIIGKEVTILLISVDHR